MKLPRLSSIKLKNGWTIDYLRIAFAYEGVLEGGPSEWLNDSVIRGCKIFIKTTTGQDTKDINVIPRYKDELLPANERFNIPATKVLKPIKVLTSIMDATQDNITHIATFLNEEEELEDVLNEILSDPNLIIKSFMW